MNKASASADMNIRTQILVKRVKCNLLAALGPGVYSASNRNEYQKHNNNVLGSRAAAGA
jgi:hypothetical protein